MPLYLLRVGCWFRFSGGYTLYERGACLDRDAVETRLIGTDLWFYHDGGMPVEPFNGRTDAG